MSPRSAFLLLALAPLAACTWESRPDGADAVHAASDGFYDDGNEAVDTPLGSGRGLPEAAAAGDALPIQLPEGGVDAPVPTPTPAPTTGTEDDVSAVEEALTPGQ